MITLGDFLMIHNLKSQALSISEFERQTGRRHLSIDT